MLKRKKKKKMIFRCVAKSKFMLVSSDRCCFTNTGDGGVWRGGGRGGFYSAFTTLWANSADGKLMIFFLFYPSK